MGSIREYVNIFDFLNHEGISKGSRIWKSLESHLRFLKRFLLLSKN